MTRQRFLAGAAAALLALATAAAPAPAQAFIRPTQLTVGRELTVSYGPGYTFSAPSVTHPAYGFYPGYAGGDTWPGAGFNAGFGSYDRPIMMTSIYYPNVYGRHVLGLSGYAYRLAPSFVPTVPAVALEAPRGTPALVDVVLPADAALEFQGVLTALTGSARRFQSPPLDPGQAYTYDVRATWRDNGRDVVRTRQVEVRAGDRLEIDFSRTPAEEGRSTLRAEPVPAPQESRRLAPR